MSTRILALQGLRGAACVVGAAVAASTKGGSASVGVGGTSNGNGNARVRRRAGEANAGAAAWGGRAWRGGGVVRCEGNEAAAKGGEDAPSFRDSVVGSYENRIRNFSPPERVFEYYASVEKDGVFFMTPNDFARSITPFSNKAGDEVGSKNFKYNWQARNRHPSQPQKDEYKALLAKVLSDSKVTADELKQVLRAREDLGITSEAHLEALRQLDVSAVYFEELCEAKGGLTRSHFFSLVDLDGDGVLSFEEYILFRTLLALPLSRLGMAFHMFDRDDSGKIDEHEFSQLMAAMRGRTNAGGKGAKSKEGGRGGGQQLDIGGGGINKVFFGEDGSKQLSLSEFSAFVKELRAEALRLQFLQWDADGSGELSALEFANFLLTTVSADRALEKRVKSHLSRNEAALQALGVSVSLSDFLAYMGFLSYLDEMKVAMWVSGTQLSLEGFLKAARAATIKANREEGGRSEPSSPGGVEIPPPGVSESVAKVLFALFDADGDGCLSSDEFLGLMERQKEGEDPSRELGVVHLLATLLECARQEVAS